MEYVNESREGSQVFYALLEEIAHTHEVKHHDYASDDDPSGNYHFAGNVAVLFAHSPDDMGFLGRLAEKIYRLANLTGSNKIPKNESVEDTEKDIATITVLWMADRRERKQKEADSRVESAPYPESESWAVLLTAIDNLTNEQRNQLIKRLMR
jgi:hypothetical protein